ncbi:tyrosine-type recombinase/integrase [Spirillospora sp. NPDC048819]|uniref:tyrosine-type recombinase/integrase n=1 Tax=Spirillospora sp. NPDC048819 TaxID=3155268 RepID=UPI0033C9F821
MHPNPAKRTGGATAVAELVAIVGLAPQGAHEPLRSAFPEALINKVGVSWIRAAKPERNYLFNNAVDGLKGGPLRRSGFNKVTNWRHVVKALGVPNLHFHDLRHTGNQLAADMGVSTKNLMARMGHDNERAALRYQHRSAKGDRIIADGLDALVQAERDQGDEEDGDDDGTLVPVA